VRVAIHQPHYLPWLRYFDKIARSDVFVLLDDAQYNKNGWQNRNKIKGPQGWMYLTVPVREASGGRILDAAIADDVWRDKHWKSLVSCYGRAPHFAAFRDAMADVYARPWERLFDLNLAMLRRWLDLLGIRTEVARSSELNVTGAGTPRLVEILKRVGGTTYVTGDFAAANHMDDELFTAAGIAVELQGWRAPVYRQQFPKAGFIPDLAIVDLFCNEGPQATQILASRQAAPAASA
jgi:hypothetical protein